MLLIWAVVSLPAAVVVNAATWAEPNAATAAVVRPTTLTLVSAWISSVLSLLAVVVVSAAT